LKSKKTRAGQKNIRPSKGDEMPRGCSKDSIYQNTKRSRHVVVSKLNPPRRQQREDPAQ